MIIRQLTRDELDEVLDWAANEGWNPGLHDAEAFWAADNDAFLGVEEDGELIGSGAVVSYGGEFGFMGLFIVKPEFRSRGIGANLWFHRRDRLISRLNPKACIAMDGVFAMQSFYAKGGFVFTHRNLRMAGIAESASKADSAVVELAEVRFEEIEAFDRKYFPAKRTEFLSKWIRPEGGKALGFFNNKTLSGFGVIRPCRTGYKIGPLFADNPESAEALFVALAREVPGEPIFLDTPENNPAALALAARHGLKESFGCARMILGKPPALPWGGIYGVTTFELG